MLDRNTFFDHFIQDDLSSINKVQVVGDCVTIYFKPSNFDDVPDIWVDGFLPITERAKFHNALHVNDAQQKDAHIHFVTKDNSPIGTQKLSNFFKQLVEAQKETMLRATNCFFKVKPFITETQVAILSEAYEGHILQNRNNKK